MKNEHAKKGNNCFQQEKDELIRYIFQMECNLFVKMDSYRLIEQKCDKKCLTPDEKQRLNTDIQHVFTRLIRTIKQACPNLTDDDVLFCCLAKSGLDNSIIGRSMGNVGRQVVNWKKRQP